MPAYSWHRALIGSCRIVTLRLSFAVLTPLIWLNSPHVSPSLDLLCVSQDFMNDH